MGSRAGRVGVWVASALALGIASGAAPTFSQTRATPQRPVFRGGIDLVAVDVYPRHRDGRLIEGLTAADFEVLEDGKPQAIEQFEFVRIEPAGPLDQLGPAVEPGGLTAAADPHRRLFVTYLDLFHLMVPGGPAVSAPVGTFHHRNHGEGDLFGFLAQTIPATAMLVGRHPSAVTDALLKHWPTGQVYEMRDPQDEVERTLELCYNNPVSAPLIARHRMLRTMNHLGQLFEFVDQLRPARTVVLLIADTWPTPGPDSRLIDQLAVDKPAVPDDIGRRGSPIDRIRAAAGGSGCRQVATSLAAQDLATAHRNLIGRAQASNVLIYVIAPSHLEGPASARADGLYELAHNTGGRVVATAVDFERSPAWIADDTSAFYLLGYRSTNRETDGTLRQIRVRVKQPDVRVTARRSYRAPSAEMAAAATLRADADAAVPDAVRKALGALEATERASELLVSGVEWATSGTLRVTVEIPVDAFRRGPWARGADVELTMTAEGAEVRTVANARLENGARAAVVTIPIEAVASPWRVAVRVRSGEAVLTERTVISPGAGVLAGDGVFFRGGPAVRSPYVPTVEPVFGRTERVRVEWPLRGGPVDGREARLLTRRGQPMPLAVTVTERADSGGAPVIVADLALAPLAAGDYVIELTLARGGETEQKHAAFRLSR